jgi:hypothetical protein
MRTTVTLEKAVAAAVAKLRREEGIGLSEAVNRLARAGLVQRQRRQPFRQRSVDAGLLIDVTNVAEALELAEGPDHR